MGNTALTYRLRVDARNKNLLYASADSPTWQTDLRNYFTPGEFINVQGQEFRVCMNMDPTFVTKYGSLNASEIALCGVADPYTAKSVDAGYAGRVIADVPVMKLSTVVGGVANPLMGATTITITNM